MQGGRITSLAQAFSELGLCRRKPTTDPLRVLGKILFLGFVAQTLSKDTICGICSKRGGQTHACPSNNPLQQPPATTPGNNPLQQRGRPRCRSSPAISPDLSPDLLMCLPFAAARAGSPSPHPPASLALPHPSADLALPHPSAGWAYPLRRRGWPRRDLMRRASSLRRRSSSDSSRRRM